MFSLIRASEEHHLIDEGRVSCPLREGDADVEACLQCSFAGDVALTAEAPFVSCRPPRRLLLLP